jgi:long-subunit acyl-CoA synthetase (AMP-forming)
VGSIAAGCVNVGIYATNSAPTCQRIAAHCDMRVVVCQTRQQRDMFVGMRAALPSLRAVVVYGDTVAESYDGDERPVWCVNWEVRAALVEPTQWRRSDRGSDTGAGCSVCDQRFLSSGEGYDAAALESRSALHSPENCCTLIYTSGTTGDPKGVMIRCVTAGSSTTVSPCGVASSLLRG